MLTQELVRELFDYKDGELYRKVKVTNNTNVGDLAGSINKHTGYRVVMINGKQYRLHRVIYLYHHGYLPEFIDHIDCNKLNNAIENLRAATKSDNEKNKNPRTQDGKTSRYKGVHWNSARSVWHARIRNSVKGMKYLGCYKDEKEAAKAYNEAAIKYFGEFARLNIIEEGG